MGVKVINCSWIWGEEGIPFERIIVDILNKTDALYVFSAKNIEENNNDNQIYKALNKMSNVIVVGAINQNGETLYRVGKDCDLVAPGVDIYSTAPNEEYVEESGTSFSAPFVSGVAALMFSYDEEMPAKVVKQLIVEAANDHTVIPGLLDAGNTLEKLIHKKL